MYQVKQGDLLLAEFGTAASIPRGRTFVTNGQMPLQWATFAMDRGTETQRHVHKPREFRFQGPKAEMFVVLDGRMSVSLYGPDKALVRTLDLWTGDYICCYAGGHGFKMLEHTKFLEIGLGPYNGVENDKEKF